MTNIGGKPVGDVKQFATLLFTLQDWGDRAHRRVARRQGSYGRRDR